jgi:valyl-tRNA synthetase
MGHVLNNTLQDLLVRFKRMDGHVTLWLPGTDHAGIATQNVVEKQLASEGISRHDLGRAKFEERVWAWKEKYGSTILRQLKKLGSSCDWRRERFTMDPGLSHAVREVFVRLYEKDLIYRGHRIIHWCPRCHTALSDEEAITTEGGEPGNLWHIRYPAADGGNDAVVVATTRPETMLGDTGVAVHPDDERYRHLIGKNLRLPLMNREIPVIPDDLVDPQFGTGAVKVTPAHDANDYEMAQRHALQPIVIMDIGGVITENGGAYAGLDRFEARKRVVADLEAQGLLVKTQPYQVPIRRCERCKTIIEPYLSDQWFVRMEPLAKPAIEAVRNGKLRLYPERWVGVYLHWLENIRDWCISRQLWWGHRIPVWYCDDCGKLTVARADTTQCSHCWSARIRQDEDVLDTWFSSWLWPFSTMGWPEETATLKRFYPTDTLVTAADIIFFWVARMVMAGYEFMGERPFSQVCFNSVVRDLQGRKMSKSLGNSPDPLDVIAEYGADALRFTIVSLAPPGEDVMFASEKTDLGRHFANKIWNAARFVMMNLSEAPEPIDRIDVAALALPERWILSRLQTVTNSVRTAYDSFRFNDGALALYQFIWHEYCDWYLELSKNALYGDDVEAKRRVQSVLLHILEQAMRLLHPFMPFVTEEIWQALPGIKAADSVMVAAYPKADEARRDTAAESAMTRLTEAVRGVRNIRAELGIAPTTPLSVHVAPTDGAADDIRKLEPYFKAMARVDEVELLNAGEKPAGEPFTAVAGLGSIYVPLRGAVDAQEVCKRLERDLGKVEKELAGVEKKLARADFVDRAPQEIVAKEREKLDMLRERRTTLLGHLDVLRQES